MTFNTLDCRIARWMDRRAPLLLRISLAIVFIWFGALKLTGDSPANQLIARTVYWFDPKWFIPVLGIWEILIGACMLWRPLIRASILLLFLQMPGTFLPLVLLPDVCFVHVPWRHRSKANTLSRTSSCSPPRSPWAAPCANPEPPPRPRHDRPCGMTNHDRQTRKLIQSPIARTRRKPHICRPA